MTCFCGDTACGSCGPAQGFGLGLEAACEQLVAAVPALAGPDEAACGDLSMALVAHFNEQMSTEADRLAKLILTRLKDFNASPLLAKAIENLAYEVRTGEMPYDEAEELRIDREYAAWSVEQDRLDRVSMDLAWEASSSEG